MVVLLFILLLLNFPVIYFFNGKKIISPSFLVNFMMFLSCFVLLAFWDYFGREDINFNTVIVVYFSIIFIFLGETTADLTKKTEVKSSSLVNLSAPKQIAYSKLFLFVICLIGVYVTIGRGYALYKLSLYAGNDGGLISAFAYARRYVNSGHPIEVSRLVTYPAAIVKACSYYLMFVFLHNYLLCKKVNISLLLPIVIYGVYTLTSTARAGVTEILCVFIFLYLILLQRKKHKNKRDVLKSVLPIVLTSSFFLVVFFVAAGNIRSIDYSNNSAGDLINYVGSPIIVFNRWMLKDISSPYIGYATFPSLINILSQLGITNVSVGYFEMYSSEDALFSSKSNLKTWLRAPIQDFGIIGMLLFMFAIGFFYKKAVNKISERDFVPSRHECFYIMTSWLFYPLFASPVAFRFSNFIQLEFVIVFLCLLFLTKNKLYTKTLKFNFNSVTKGMQ